MFGAKELKSENVRAEIVLWRHNFNSIQASLPASQPHLPLVKSISPESGRDLARPIRSLAV